jgi:predicted  nucleic acid-binding Zn-ribbon protein
LSWVADLWKILETIATLTKEVERTTSEIKELRRDVNTLTLSVSQLENELTNEKATTQLVLENFEKDGEHLKESINSRFDVLITRLDSKIAAFETRVQSNLSDKKSPRSLESGLDD